MRVRSLSQFFVALVSSGWLFAADQPPHADPPAASRQAGESASVRTERRQMAAALVARLGSPQFEVREEATRKLQALGADAIEPMLAAAGGENLEVTCRAIRALAAIYESDDDEIFDAAEAALEKLAESPNRSAAQRAAEVLAPQDVAWEQGLTSRGARRWKRAVVRIRALGGIVTTRERQDRQILGAGIETDSLPQDVRLTQEWKGGSAGLVNIKRLAASLPRSLYAARGGPPLYIIDGADVPADGLAQLRQSIPALEIQHRGAARLGVASSAQDGNCRITEVEKGGGADRAGIKQGDIIQKYDGQSVLNFNHLAEITSGHKVGDKVELEVLRDGETIKIQAELTGWSSNKAAEAKK
jgi:hypothetical protein